MDEQDLLKDAIRFEIQEAMRYLIADGHDPTSVRTAFGAICADEILRGAQAMVPESMRGARKEQGRPNG